MVGGRGGANAVQRADIARNASRRGMAEPTRPGVTIETDLSAPSG